MEGTRVTSFTISGPGRRKNVRLAMEEQILTPRNAVLIHINYLMPGDVIDDELKLVPGFILSISTPQAAGAQDTAEWLAKEIQRHAKRTGTLQVIIHGKRICVAPSK